MCMFEYASYSVTLPINPGLTRFWHNFIWTLNGWKRNTFILPLKFPAKWCSTIIFITDSFVKYVLYFPLFPPHSLHFRRENSRWEWVRKGNHSVFQGVFFSSGSCQLVLAAAHFDFWEVQGISNTPRIISALQKSHEMVFNLALCYLGFPNLSYFSLFCSIFRSFPSKELLMGIIRFFRFWLFPVAGRVGWFWQPLTLLFEKCKESPIPLE